eukprot:Gregarina_sp_Pseudo_9__2000@NODE_2386_length_1012_cov_2_542652_g2198_i0_p1_GENE_NODE_2386_length_1012_cov_2_542652_g2198_i0NODE_2386_length_1012_cov_2_542652_g2198_i0_p1_ORF_typecomplete_len279_score18_08zfC3HC4_3/PF13920_6/6_5e14ProkRING_4/PF14447_6/7_1e08zfRING_2/PF13639_6/0_0074zfRING_5/PF14634_6/0_017zfC3HC4_2/PF13923_6/0_28zfP11/PF03854_14/0_85zfRING_UBOX/PF13445_6/0_53zfRING_UBOX/PF13445_6/2_5e02_NODE_2386_length_1012_cov_2_542652_g2198_i0175978
MGGVWSDETADSDPGIQNLSQPIVSVDSTNVFRQPRSSSSSMSKDSAKALPVRNPFVLKFDEIFLKASGKSLWNLNLKYTALQRCQAILYRHVTASSVTDLDSCSTPETVPADWEPRIKRDLDVGENITENLSAGSFGNFADAGTELLLLNITPLTMEHSWQQWYYLKFEPFKSGAESYMLRQWEQKMQMGKQLYSIMKIYSTKDEAEQAAPAICLICSSSAANTMVLPCRHLCLCTECAAVMRLRDQKCPICRGTITSLLQLEVTQ